MLFLASLTDPIVQFAVDVVDKMGLPGIFVLMVAESACIPIPSEATMLFAGFNVSEGSYSLPVVVAVATTSEYSPLETLKPANSIVASDGIGRHALSATISRKIPGSPSASACGTRSEWPTGPTR